ncbi:MAG: nucleoside transporter C-terminal domain-containing protein [Pseudomonadota bacterium]
MIALLGVPALLLIAVLFSENRKAIRVKDAAMTFGLQLAIAIFAVATPIGAAVLGELSGGVRALLGYAQTGASFVFGPLADGGSGLILAFQVLPVIIFIASLVNVLFHLKVMDFLIRTIGGALRKATGASRLESTCAAANIFVGMAEAPLVILPYLPKLSRAQLFVIMGLGLSSVAGSVMLAYAALGMDIDLLLTAAFMAAPGGLLITRILVPETETPFDIGGAEETGEASASRHGSVMEAATDGALIGLQIMLNVIAVLIAFVAGVALLNGILGGVGGLVGAPSLSLEQLFGYAFAPVAVLIGTPLSEAVEAGQFLGQKVVLNEFLAYANFSSVMEGFSAEGRAALTVALCGFANLSGLAVLIAGLGSLAPERRSEISKLGLKTVLAGTLSNFLSAAIVSALLGLGRLVGG